MIAIGPRANTFSIVGYDPEEPAWGIAIASKFLAVGSRSTWGSPEAGVVVIQAHLNAHNGSGGVKLLRQGVPANEVISRLMERDPHRELRQMAVVDRQGNAATYTGKDCGFWAGGKTGNHCAAQGNMLMSGLGVEAMVHHFEHSTGPLARRLVDSLAMGHTMGGDSRGKQAAALLVIRPFGEEAYDVYTDPYIDLRVDDHPEPYMELSRLLDLYELVYLPTAPGDQLPATYHNVSRVQRALAALGFYSGPPSGSLDDPTRAAIESFARLENLSNRLPGDNWLDVRYVEHLETLAWG